MRYMTESDRFKGIEPAWCPGCGNFAILKAFNDAVLRLGIEPHQFIVVSGIGQAGKLPHYTRCNTFNGLHGRTLPVATGIRLANHKMPVIAIAGDGDCYGEGGNHLIHAIRRNINVKLLVHDNQIYGLTKGQASPTSGEGMVTKNMPSGVISEPLNPLAIAVALDAGFAARAFAGDPEHLTSLIVEAVNYDGFCLIDILQPCVTFNKINTYEWYRSRVYRLEKEYDPYDRKAAFDRALEWGEKIPLGIIYKSRRQIYEDRVPMLSGTPLVRRPAAAPDISQALKEFY